MPFLPGAVSLFSSPIAASRRRRCSASTLYSAALACSRRCITSRRAGQGVAFKETGTDGVEERAL